MSKASGSPPLTSACLSELELRLVKQHFEGELASHQQTQAALNAHKREFKTLVDNAPDIITRFDRELRHLYVNPAVSRVTGLPPEAFIGKTNRELGMPEEEVAFWERELQAVFASGESRSFEFAFEGKRGLRHFQARVTPEFGDAGEVATVVAVVRDISEHKAAEAALKALVAATSGGHAGFLSSLARALAEALGVRWVFLARLLSEREAEVVASYGEALDGVVYELENTPCASALEAGSCLYPREVCRAFPKDAMLKQLGAESYLGTPVRDKEGRTLGILMALHDRALEQLSELQRWLFEAFAQRAADELVQQANLHRLEASVRAAEALRLAGSAAEVYRAILAAILSQTRAQTANLLLYDEASDTLRVAQSCGHHADKLEGRVLERGEGVSWRVFDGQVALYLPHVGREEQAVFASDEARQGAYIGAPIRAGDGRVLGVLAADTAGPQGWQMFSLADRIYLETLAQAAGAALTRLEALEEARRESERFRALAALSAKLELLDDPNDIAHTALEALLPLTNFDQGSLWRLEGETIVPTIMVGAFKVQAAQAFEARNVQLAPGILGRTIETRQTQWIGSYQHDPAALKHYIQLGFRSVVATPLQLRGKVYGVVVLSSLGHAVAPSPAIAHLLEAVAHRLERALERAQNQQELLRAHESALMALGLALEYRDYETKGHTERVTALAERLGRSFGLDDKALRDLRWGAYLHDTGKVAIADQILLKPGRLTPEEFERIKAHVLIGERMLRRLDFLPERVLQIVRHHHERWDGGGYPDGLKGEAIPLLARLFAVIDVYDALTSERPYKRAWTQSEALDEICAQRGKQFDPLVVDAFLALFTLPATVYAPLAVPGATKADSR
jgi:PAS domain S-box-containing protein/putative nucleotidyltransferase with HDIG domain